MEITTGWTDRDQGGKEKREERREKEGKKEKRDEI